MRVVEINVDRGSDVFRSNHRRVITRYLDLVEDDMIQSVVDRVMQFSEEEVENNMQRVLTHFTDRHHCLNSVLLKHYNNVSKYIPSDTQVSEGRRLLMGSYFTMEYSIESAALFNPSIVAHPDQTGVSNGGTRLLMSLRATGEGHISSIVFREGEIHHDGTIVFESPGDSSRTGEIVQDHQYSKALFLRKLTEMQCHSSEIDRVLDKLESRFTVAELEIASRILLGVNQASPAMKEAVGHLRYLAHANYELQFDSHTDPSDMVIFPTSVGERSGMEDVRLVRFVDDDEQVTYYGTYTAYDGRKILPQMFETTDFQRFRVMTLAGRYAQDKGMAMFPRKIDGRYVMVSRLDGENLYLMYSDNPHIWNNATLLQKPVSPWESVKIGNCGSPLETDKGWLLLTHGVGPMRQYCIGALLLDLNDPGKVIGKTREPILVPTEAEREGYVPNVVYTCGAVIHKNTLVMPYAMSDLATGFATFDLDELMTYMQPQPIFV